MTMIERHVQAMPARQLAKSAKRLLRDADVWGGRLLFGNTTPAVNNISGRLAFMRPTVRFGTGVFRSARAREFRRSGIAVLGIPFDQNLINEIAGFFARMIEDDRHSSPFAERPVTLARIANRSYGRKLHDPRSVPKLEALMVPDIIERLEDHYGAHFRIVTVEMYRTYHVEPHIHAQVDAYSCWWHCDQRPTDLVKLFVNLSDVDAGAGPFMAATKAMTAQLLRSERFHRRHEAAFEPNERDLTSGRVVALTGPAGMTMLCNTQECLHRAGVPQPGRHRDLLQFMLISAGTRLKPGWLQSIEPRFGQASRYRRPG